MNCRGIFEVDKKKDEITKLEKEMTRQDFWDDQDNAKKITGRISNLKEDIQISEKLTNSYDELETFLNLLNEDFDPELATEAEQKLIDTKKFLEDLE
ncbi:MAG: PCRF domain-containing protein, partial [Candidatus Cloacimonetes bacterium]|nr:PCRF domain-containing protein [Candidatus Cloacimonadota bacterium]